MYCAYTSGGYKGTGGLQMGNENSSKKKSHNHDQKTNIDYI